MIILTVLVIYNVAVTIAILPSYNNVVRVKNNAVALKQADEIKLPDVFMHVIIDVNEQIDVTKYLPSIRELSDKHTGYNYNLIFIVNDTVVEKDPYSIDELNNEVVLDDMFHTKMFTYTQITKQHNINIMQISLSKYMSCSPIKKRWRLIQPDFIPFIVRAISIWDSRGIAFNPLIIKSGDQVYIEKLHDILEIFGKPKKETVKETTVKSDSKIKNTVNNIRDIIEALESDNRYIDHSQENLTEADTNRIEISQGHGRKLLSVESYSGNEINKNHDEKSINSTSQLKNNTFNDVLPKIGILPLFFKLILNTKSQSDENQGKSSQVKSPILIANKTQILDKPKEIVDKVKPMIMTMKVKDEKHASKEIELKESYYSATWDKYEKLTLDLKGNVIASEVSCHAFIGTMFDNIFHKPEEENVSGFLIRELSLFCKGVLSRCRGIDVILI